MSDLRMDVGDNRSSVEHLAKEIIEGAFDLDLMALRIDQLAERGERSEEILSMALAFKNAAIQVGTSHNAVADLCGTGGARFRTFNVSTASSFILAASGIPVAKHGNRSQNGSCGSADVIESLGAPLLRSPEEASAILDRLGFCFLFAPGFHPAMGNAVPIRERLNKRTIFNAIGPLLNPVTCPRRQLIGVYDPRLLDTLPQVLEGVGIERALLVHGYPGMDEASTLGSTEVAEVRGQSVERYQIHPEEFDIPISDPKSLREVKPKDAAKALRNILSGAEGSLRDIVVLNSACAMVAFGRSRELDGGLRLAERTIDSGDALRKLDQFLSASKEMSEFPISYPL